MKEALVCELAITLLETKDLKDRPPMYKGTQEQKKAMLQKLAAEIVGEIWNPPNKDTISEVHAAGSGVLSPYCVCKQSKRHDNN